jgi:hypothetical protein
MGRDDALMLSSQKRGVRILLMVEVSRGTEKYNCVRMLQHQCAFLGQNLNWKPRKTEIRRDLMSICVGFMLLNHTMVLQPPYRYVFCIQL